MPVDFQDYAQERQFDVDTYPGAAGGQKALAWIKRFVIITIVVAIIGFASGVAVSYLMGEYEGGADIPLWLLNGLQTFNGVINTILIPISVIGIVLSVIAYMVFTVIRWRNYERDCLANDLRARSLKRSIIRTLAIDRHIRDIRDKHRKANRNSKELGGERMSFEDESKLNALMSIKNMKVFVNTRQSLDDEQIEQRYRVIIDAPFIQKESEDLQNLLKGFDQVATRMEKGRVSFGSQVISADQSKIEYMDAIIVPDKYAFEVVREDGTTQVGDYESTFPLSLFVDRQDEIDKKTQQANRWAFRTAGVLDDLLTTMEMPAKRTGVNAGAVNVKYEYKMSFKLNEDRVDRLPDKLDQRFNTSGSTAESHGDSLSITIAVPQDLKRPINVPTLYREVFG